MPKPNKTYNSVQLNIDFTAQVGDGTGRLSDAMLYSNISRNSTDLPSGASSFTNPNNLAVTLAKIYSWSKDIFDFNPSGTKKITIKDGIAKDTTYTFATGTTPGKFSVTPSGGSAISVLPYKNIHAENITIDNGSTVDSIKLQWKQEGGNTWTDLKTVTLGLLDNGGKIKNSLLPSYVDDVIEGYLHYTLLTSQPSGTWDPTKYFKLVDGKYVRGTAGDAWAANTWYSEDFYTDDQYTTKIDPEAGKIYVDLATDNSYRWGGTTYVKISNPTDVFSGASSGAAGTSGLVPAPAAGDQNKYLKGDGTWGVVDAADNKVIQKLTSTNKNYPVIFSYYETSNTSTTPATQQVNRVNSIYVNPSTGMFYSKGITLDNSSYSITFKSGSTTYGGIGMTAANGDLKRWKADLSTSYVICDTNNTTWTQTVASSAAGAYEIGKVKIGGASAITVYGVNTWTALVGATSSANGTGGYISAAPPSDGYNTKFFRADGTWAVPYTHPTYTAYTGKPTSNQTPKFGGTFTLSQVISDGTGHVSEMNDKTVKIPDAIFTIAATGERGLVPGANSSTDANKYLRSDATWGDPMSEYDTLILNCTYDTTVT